MASCDDYIDPPNTRIVDHEYKPVLYLPDGRALVRQAGFRTGAVVTNSGLQTVSRDGEVERV